MKKNLLLYVLLVFLIVVNGFFLVNYLGKPNYKGPKGKQDNFIVRELKFDDDQKQKFEELDKEHHERIREISDVEKELKDNLFDILSNEKIIESQIDSITSQIGDIAKAKELEIFNHFRGIQSICNDKQKEKFEHILKKALRGKGPNGQGPPPPDRRREGDGPPPKRH